MSDWLVCGGREWLVVMVMVGMVMIVVVVDGSDERVMILVKVVVRRNDV